MDQFDPNEETHDLSEEDRHCQELHLRYARRQRLTEDEVNELRQWYIKNDILERRALGLPSPHFSATGAFTEAQRGYRTLAETAENVFSSQVDIIRMMVRGELNGVELHSMQELLMQCPAVRKMPQSVDDTLLFLSQDDAVRIEVEILRQHALELLGEETFDTPNEMLDWNTVNGCLDDVNGDGEKFNLLRDHIGKIVHGVIS